MVRAQDCPCTNPHCRSGYGWGSVLHVFSGHNRRHKSVSRAQKRAAKFLRHMWKARLGSRDKVRLICSLSDTMRNTYDVVYDVVYDIVYCISYTISVYTMSYMISYIAHRIRHCIRYRMRYPFLLPLRFIQPVLVPSYRTCFAPALQGFSSPAS